MTVVKGDVVFVRSDAFHHAELPAIVVSPGGNSISALVLASGHSPFLIENLKEIDYWDDPAGFYQLNHSYPPKPLEDPVNANASEELSEGGDSPSSDEGDGSGLVSSSKEETEESESDGESESEEEPEEVDESEADEEASKDSEDSDSEDPVVKPKARASSRRRR